MVMPGPVLCNFEGLQNSEDLYALLGSELCFLAPAISQQVIDIVMLFILPKLNFRMAKSLKQVGLLSAAISRASKPGLKVYQEPNV
jgi:hypothetical protein